MEDGEKAEIEAQLTALYGEGESDEKVERRNRVITPEGINAFQRTALRGQVKRLADEPPSQGSDGLDSGPGPLVPVGDEYADDIPEPVEGYEGRVDVVAAIKAQVGIVEAVQRWGKPQAALKIGSKTDGIHVRCPFPHHTDNNPSAWINTAKNTWFCGGCQVGGDQIDFYAAAVRGITPNEFHSKDEFRPVIIEIAEQLGIDPEPPPDTPPHHIAPEPEPQPPAPAPPPPPPPVPDERSEPETVTIEQMTAGIDPDSLEFDPRDASDDPLEVSVHIPTYDWRNLMIPEGTFLHEWMTQNEKDFVWIPPEYFLMLGFQAIGMACGHEMTTTVMGMNLTASTMFTIIGPSGYGKTTAVNRLRDMFRNVTGSKWDPELGTGVKIFPTPGSPEAFLTKIRHEIEDLANPGSPKMETATTAWLFEQEFATFVSRAHRKGGEHMKQRLIEFHDFTKSRDDPELVVEDFSLMNGQREVHDAFLTCTFLTQTDALRRQVEDVDMVSGFFNRIVPVFGLPRGRRSMFATVDPDPEYRKFYSNLWNALRTGARRQIPVSDASMRWVDDSPFFLEAEQWGNQHSILARTGIITHRFAFMLAVNELAKSIEPRHYEIASHFVKNYILPCYGHMVKAAKATEARDTSDKVLDFCREHYARTGQWPTWRDLTRVRFWRNAPSQVQFITRTNLLSNHLIGIVDLMSNGKQRTTIVIATDQDDEWKVYGGQDGNKYERDGFYANA